MAIVFDNWGTAASAASSGFINYMATVNANDQIVVPWCAKNFNITSVTITGAWLNDITSGTSGSVASSADAGSTLATVSRHIAAGTEGGTPATYAAIGGTQSVVLGRMGRFHIDPGNTWDTPTGKTARDIVETGTTVSATSSGGTVSLRPGDFLVIGVTLQSDTLTHTSQTFAASGVTVSAVSWQAPDGTAVGNDAGIYVGFCNVTSGTTASTDFTYTATASVSGKSATAVTVLRLREIFSNPPRKRNQLQVGPASRGPAIYV